MLIARLIRRYGIERAGNARNWDPEGQMKNMEAYILNMGATRVEHKWTKTRALSQIHAEEKTR